MKPITLTEKRFFEWHEDDISVTLRNKSGSYGGGSEVLVVCDRSGPVQPMLDREQNDVADGSENRLTSSAMRNNERGST